MRKKKKEGSNRSLLLFKSIIVFISLLSVISLSYIAYLFILYPSSEYSVYKKEVAELPKTGDQDKYHVFITSATYGGDFGGRNFADSECDRLGEFGEWVAFIGTDDQEAFSRPKETIYYLMDNSTVVVDWSSGIVEGAITNNINKNEHGEVLSDAKVWTGYGIGLSESCNNWTSTTYIGGGGEGINNDVNDWYDDALASCNKSNHLYCFEVLKDSDSDGYNEDVDCDDSNSAVYPSAPEICDGLDNNCDGVVPNNERDGDSDRYRVCDGDCDDNNNLIYPLASEICDGLDNNCDGVVPNNERDIDSDGYKVCDGDCNDSSSAVNPSVSDICDGVDNDCDGSTDEGLIRSCGTNVGICTKGIEKCVNGVWGNCNGVQPQKEVCDGLDNDCNGIIDEGCSCDSGTTQPCGTDIGICRVGTQWCEGGAWGKCYGNIDPGFEICDGRDNDCDGNIDESLNRSCGSDIGECEKGVQYCIDGEWGECQGGVQAVDESCDSLDNNCDGAVDEGCICQLGEERVCGIDTGECEGGIQTCVDEEWGECEGGKGLEEEICDDLDNDCDGEIDEDYVCEEEEEKEREKEMDVELTDSIEDHIDTGKSVFSAAKDIFSKIRAYIIILFAISFSILLGYIGYKKFIRYRKDKKENVFRKSEKVKSKDTKKSPLSNS